MGGKPNRGTAADKRLAANKGKTSSKGRGAVTASKPFAAFGGKKANPFGSGKKK